MRSKWITFDAVFLTRCFLDLIRNLFFIAATFIMIGHDIVPHSDIYPSESMSSYSNSKTTSVQDIGKEHTELSHLFEHLRHASQDGSLKYVAGGVKDLGVKTKILQNFALTAEMDDTLLWHTNRVKQRFWTYSHIPYYLSLPTYTLRGPPTA